MKIFVNIYFSNQQMITTQSVDNLEDTFTNLTDYWDAREFLRVGKFLINPTNILYFEIWQEDD